MKKLLLVALLVCGVTATSFAQLVQSTTTVTERTYGKQKKELGKIRYQGELNIGFATGGKLKNNLVNETADTNFSRPFLETVHGVRVGDYLFAGMGLGVQYAYGDYLTGVQVENYDSVPSWNTAMMPIFLNLKGYYPVSERFAPYISLSLGATAVLASDLNESFYSTEWGESYESKLKGGFYCDFGVGFTARKFNFGFGLMHQSLKGSENYDDAYDSEHYEAKLSCTSFYVKVGLKF